MDILEHAPLAPFTSFHIGGPARFLISAEKADDVIEGVNFARTHALPFFILGGGSNILMHDDGFPGVVIRVALRGVSHESITDDQILFTVPAGETWDDFVTRAVSAGLWGIENLSFIPGTVGASAVQNIGAYGQEARQSIVSLEVYDTHRNACATIDARACDFGYRSSIFNGSARGRYVILSVTFKLSRQGQPLQTYPGVKKYFAESGNPRPTLADMRQAIIAIRQRKLPDPRIIGNAGSFFKNVITDETDFKRIRAHIETNFDTVATQRLDGFREKFTTPAGIKIPNAFLIELCDLKHASVGGAAVYETHALVITNSSGTATAADVIALASHIRRTVYKKTGAVIVPEPELVGFASEEISSFLSLS